MRRTRWLSAAALVAVAALAGCGSSVSPSQETIGPLGEGLGVPGFTLPSAAPAAPGPATSATGSTTPTTAASQGRRATSLPTSLASTTAIQPSQSQGGAAGSTGPAPTSATSNSPKATGPITVGFLTTATTNAAQYGASNGNTVSETGIDDALINALNKQGGIDGRQIKVVFAHTDTGGSDWAGEFQAACATFTQDNHVDAVLGYAFDYAPAFESCLAQKGIPHISDSYAVTSDAEMAKYPLYWSLSTPPIEQREMAKYEGAMNTGVLTPSNKLGVILDTCAGNQAAWQGAVLPFLQAHHINVAPPFTIACGTGQNAGIVATVGSLTNVLLRFRSEGVNRISFETAEGPALLLSSIEAQAQGYHPDWIVSSLAGLSVIGGETPIPQMQHTYGFGWMPSQDTPPQYTPTKNAAQRRCLSLLHSQKEYPKAAADYIYAYDACEAVFVYADALERNGGDTTGTAVSQAIASIGTSFQSTLNLDGRSDFSAARHNDVPMVYKPINWDGDCHCFRYGSQTFTMPS